MHEKSCLLFLLPVTMLAGREPYLASALPVVAAFSMFPLLRKDDVVPAYFGANLLYLALQSPHLFPAKRYSPNVNAQGLGPYCVVSLLILTAVLLLLVVKVGCLSHELCSPFVYAWHPCSCTISQSPQQVGAMLGCLSTMPVNCDHLILTLHGVYSM